LARFQIARFIATQPPGSNAIYCAREIRPSNVAACSPSVATISLLLPMFDA
jgi:hypothetical protein